MSRLDALWQEIADYGRDLHNVPLSEIQGRLSAYKEQIMEIIKTDPSATPAGPSGTPATPGATTQPTSGSTADTVPRRPGTGPADRWNLDVGPCSG